MRYRGEPISFPLSNRILTTFNTTCDSFSPQMVYLSQIGIEARKRMDEALMQPYRRIIGPIDKKCTDIIRENRTSLVDTHQIITDWQPHRRTSTRVKETINMENEPGNTKYFFSNLGSGGRKSMNTTPLDKIRKRTPPPLVPFLDFVPFPLTTCFYGKSNPGLKLYTPNALTTRLRRRVEWYSTIPDTITSSWQS